MLWRLHRARRRNRYVFILFLLFLAGLFLLAAGGFSACSSNAGIFNSGSWQKTGLRYPHIRALAINDADPAVMYAGDEQGHIFLSTDAAQHWAVCRSAGLPVPLSLQELVLSSSMKKLYAVTSKGIFVSDDMAAHWAPLLLSEGQLAGDSYTAFDFNARQPQDLYAGTAHHGIFASVNGGKTWFAASRGISAGVAINALLFDADLQQVWAATSSGVYRSANGGLSWVALDKGLPANTTAYVVQPVSGVPNLLYLGTNRGFYRSANAGASWSSSKDNLAASSIRQILVDFRNNSSGTTVYIGANTGVYYSTTGGQNWTAVGPGLPRSQPIAALAFGADSDSQLYAAAGNVYQYPGTSSDVSPSKFVAIVIISFFFFTLYRMIGRNRRRRKMPPAAPPEAKRYR
jgi:photosystem II stability/assembly factor-like uncharacterized protein